MPLFSSRGRSRSFTALVGALGVVAATAALTPLAGAQASVTSTSGEASYLVVYKQGASTASAGAAVASAGGRVVATYPQIGVVVARSADPGFAATMRKVRNVEGAAATARFASQPAAVAVAGDALPANGVAWGDPLSGLQWDMRQINVPAAHAVTTGSASVLVADIDTGLDFTHPDLAPVYSAAASTDCTSGAPAPLTADSDRSGHGTHTAGTIAAAANGIGIVGVAPGVRLAGVRAGNDDGFFFPESVVCSFVWVAEHGVTVANNSYFADPWLYNCKNDPEQRAIWTAERRAIKYAQTRGVTVVASEGNDSTDLSHPALDPISPDTDPNVVPREVTNACAVVPVEVPGVVGVTATGNLRLKSYYSSYGISTADVAAPGGDRRLQVTADAVNGRVLSTFSSTGTICAPALEIIVAGARYCYLQGTSMAAPHATGVAALIASASGLRGSSLAAKLQLAVNPLACPTDLTPYAPFPQFSGAPQTCEGTLTQNSWYGAGEVDALKAVTR